MPAPFKRIEMRLFFERVEFMKRVKKEYTYKELAEKTGLSPGSTKKWYEDGRVPGMEAYRSMKEMGL